MAKYREMKRGQSMPDWTEDNIIASGKIKDEYILSVGPIRIKLSKEEKKRTLDTWSKLEAGIDPETNQPFTLSKLKELAKFGAI